MTTLLSEYSSHTLVWCGFALLLGGFVKGVVGVGLPMIAVPLMSFVVPAWVAAAVVILPVIPTNLIQIRTGGPLIEKIKRFWPVTLGIAVGTFASAPFLIAADPRLLQFIVASIVTLYALQRIFHRDISIAPKYERSAGLGMGLFAGGIGGITMLIGPLVVIYMAALRLERDVFVGSIAFVYLATTLSIGIALASFSQITSSLVVASIAACVPATVGVVAGSWCRRYISQRLFDKLLTIMIIAIAASTFRHALS